jgi:hypothetical protein
VEKALLINISQESLKNQLLGFLPSLPQEVLQASPAQVALPSLLPEFLAKCSRFQASPKRLLDPRWRYPEWWFLKAGKVEKYELLLLMGITRTIILAPGLLGKQSLLPQDPLAFKSPKLREKSILKQLSMKIWMADPVLKIPKVKRIVRR